VVISPRSSRASKPYPEVRGLPLSELMKRADFEFDRDANILRLVAELITLLTSPSAEAVSFTAEIDTLSPTDITRAAYSAEAKHAATLAAMLEGRRASLEAIALPDRDTPNLFAVAQRLVASGIELNRLDSRRGETLAKRGDRSGAGPVRASAIGALHALREHVERALKARADLPRDLDAQIFGLLDELQRRAAGRKAGASPPSGGTSPVPEPTPR